MPRLNPWIQQLFQTPHPLIGMLHLGPLPGSPGFCGNRDANVDRAVAEAEAYAAAGFHGVMLENFGDAPFFPGANPSITLTWMTRIATEVRRSTQLPLGINVLRNDGLGALAVADAVGAKFIRINVLTGARLTDQGIISGNAHEILRLKAQLQTDVRIFADLRVKHSAPLAPLDLPQEIHDLVARGGADAVVVTGSGTGVAADAAFVTTVRQHTEAPIFLGSGVTAQNLPTYLPAATGFIVGTSIKKDGRTENPIDLPRLQKVAAALRK